MSSYTKWRTRRGVIHLTRERWPDGPIDALCGIEIDPQFDRRTNINLMRCKRCLSVVEETSALRGYRYRDHRARPRA